MISGLITVFPKFGNQTYIETKRKEVYRHLPSITEDGVNVYITVRECDYLKYESQILQNQWELKHKFNVWGEVKSVNDITAKLDLSNLYIRAAHISEASKEEKHNLFYINAHGTKKRKEGDIDNYFWVAANKAILNQEEKKNKPSYAFIKTKKNISIKEKDIVQGNVSLIQEEGELKLQALHVKVYDSCRKLVEALLV